MTSYRYNGVGQRIAWLFDNESTPDGEAKEGFDTWVYGVYDERWRLIAEIGSTTAGVLDTKPTKQWVHHHAGLSGRGGSSYIDALVLVDEDTTGSGVLDTRSRYVQNWRYDVVAMLDTNGSPTTWIDYTAYGQPLAGFLRADFDGNGNVDLTDFGVFGNEFGRGQPGGGPPCTVQDPCVADFDSDGDVDLTDFTVFSNEFGTTAGPQALPREAAGRGYAGYVHDASLADVYHVRFRVYLAELGRWSRRDPIGYTAETSLYAYVSGSPIRYLDSLGLTKCSPCASGTGLGRLVADDPKACRDKYLSSSSGYTGNKCAAFIGCITKDLVKANPKCFHAVRRALLKKCDEGASYRELMDANMQVRGSSACPAVDADGVSRSGLPETSQGIKALYEGAHDGYLVWSYRGAYLLSLGHLDDDPRLEDGCLYDPTDRWLEWSDACGGVSGVSTAAAALVYTAQYAFLGGKPLVEINFFSRGNIFKIIARLGKRRGCGWRIDPPHHGKGIHQHLWKWYK